MILSFRRRHRAAYFRSSFGKLTDKTYFSGDLDHIRVYADYRKEHDPEHFYVDDITWNDLGMDAVFRKINSCLSSSGEQYLYYLLRCPAQTGKEYEERRGRIACMESKPEWRLRLQRILDRLGCVRRADLCTVFRPEDHRPWMLFFYLFLFLLVPLTFLLFLVSKTYGVPALFGVCILNSIIHTYGVRRIRDDYDTVNYTVAMVMTMKRILRLRSRSDFPAVDSALERLFDQAEEALGRLRSVIRVGGVTRVTKQDAGEILLSLFLLDLLSYEFLKNKLGRNHRDIFTIHEAIGKLDAAIAVASYRAGMPVCTEPEVDFCAEKPFLYVTAMRHPLLDGAVPNDLVTEQPILITGSNASGKSTYLKTAALCAILAQSIGVCPAENYRAAGFRVCSSMALSDDLSTGESYYIAETRSLKRIIDQCVGKEPLLCVIDEVLRGTNTVERIAASCEVLMHLAGKRTICIAATHDIELCELLSPPYALYHFEEQVDMETMMFDYRIRPGKATSRNAINLLKLMGFEDSVVNGAHERAERYTETGVWSREDTIIE